MNTEHILFYPHKEYNTEKEITDNLRNKDYIQYGYIKLRDLNKWLNNEVVSVKMGMLTPSNKSYRGLTILESAIKRIKEQDTTALFDDEDELIPIYVFVSTETDDEWRNYLLSNGFASSRKNANREGIKIKKSDIGLHYGKHYGYDTKEVLSEKERQRKEEEELKEIQRKREEEIKEIQRKEEEEQLKRKKEEYEVNKKYFEQTLGYGANKYETYKRQQYKKIAELQKTNKYTDITINKQTLSIKTFEWSNIYLNKEGVRPLILFISILSLVMNSWLCTSLSLSTSKCFYIFLTLSIISALSTLYLLMGGGLNLPMGKWVEFSVDGKRKRIDCDEPPHHPIKKSRTYSQKSIKEKIKPPYIFCGILFIVAILGVWLA